MNVQVRLATVADAAPIGSMFARAFADDPVTTWVTPEPRRRATLLTRMNSLIARFEGVPRGATYVAEEAGTVIGAAIWQPPRPQPVNWRSVPFALRAGLALGESIPRMTRAGRAAAAARPPQRHWYLQLLGVDPAAQGTGVGSALVREHLALVDAQWLPAYLETTAQNLDFYGRLGFEPTGEITIGPGAPTEYSLLRPGRSAAN
ncbi:MAG TPA: GNAT family N-acetyltransferase [Galbitalea sp.]